MLKIIPLLFFLAAVLACSKPPTSRSKRADDAPATTAQKGFVEGSKPLEEARKRLKEQVTLRGISYTVQLDARQVQQGHVLHVSVTVQSPKSGDPVSLSEKHHEEGPIIVDGTIMNTRSSEMRWSAHGGKPGLGYLLEPFKPVESRTFTRTIPSLKPNLFGEVSKPVAKGESLSAVIGIHGVELNTPGPRYGVKLVHAMLRVSPDGVLTLDRSPIEDKDRFVENATFIDVAVLDRTLRVREWNPAHEVSYFERKAEGKDGPHVFVFDAKPWRPKEMRVHFLRDQAVVNGQLYENLPLKANIEVEGQKGTVKVNGQNHPHRALKMEEYSAFFPPYDRIGDIKGRSYQFISSLSGTTSENTSGDTQTNCSDLHCLRIFANGDTYYGLVEESQDIFGELKMPLTYYGKTKKGDMISTLLNTFKVNGKERAPKKAKP